MTIQNYSENLHPKDELVLPVLFATVWQVLLDRKAKKKTTPEIFGLKGRYQALFAHTENATDDQCSLAEDL